MYTISHTEQRVTIQKGGSVVFSDLLHDDLDAALGFLKTLNSIKTYDGLKTLETIALYKNYSLWSFHQENLFWEKIRFFIQIQPVLNFIRSHNGEYVCNDTVPYSYEALYSLFGVKKKVLNPTNKIKAWCVDLITHHIGFLITEYTLYKIRFQKTPYLVYTPDKVTNKVFNCDFRFVAVYDFLRRRNISFVESFHTSFGKNFVKNILARKRPALYFEVYKGRKKKLFSAADFNMAVFGENEKIFARSLIDNFGCSAIQHSNLIKTLTRKLSSTSLKKLVGIDDVRYTNELIIACRENNIQTTGIQHGHFTKYLVGWMNPGLSAKHSVTFDLLYVWNSYWKKVLLDYSTQYNETNVVVGGLLREPAPFEVQKRPRVSGLSGTTILVLLEPWSPKEEVGGFIKDFLKEGVNIIVSVRPDNKISDVAYAYGLPADAPIRLVSGGINEALVNSVDAVAGTYSTFLNEFLFYEKPVLLLKTSLTHGHRLVEDGLCLAVDRGSYENIALYINKDRDCKNKVWPSAPVFEDTLSSIFE